MTAVVSFESRKEVTEGLCPESRRPTPFESASAVKYLRLPTALRSKPAYRTPCSSRLSARRGMNLLASPTFCGPRFWKNSNGSETKIKPTVRLLVNGTSKNRRCCSDAAKLPRSKLRRLFVRRLDKAQKHAPVLYERKAPITWSLGAKRIMELRRGSSSFDPHHRRLEGNLARGL